MKINECPEANFSEIASSNELKAYVKPEILHELELETRAGSLDNFLDLTNLTDPEK